MIVKTQKVYRELNAQEKQEISSINTLSREEKVILCFPSAILGTESEQTSENMYTWKMEIVFLKFPFIENINFWKNQN